METNQFIKATVGVVVVFLVTIAVAIPIIGGFTESSPGETGTNTGVSDPEWGIYGMEDGTTITKANTNGDVLFNGTAQQAAETYLFTESYCLRLTDGGDFYLPYNGPADVADIIRSMNLSIQGDILAGTVDIMSVGGESGPRTLSDKLNFVLSSDAESCMTDIGYVPVNAGTADMNPFYVNQNSEIIGFYFDAAHLYGLYTGSYDSLQHIHIPNGTATPPTMSLTIGTSDRDATQITGFTTDPDLGNKKLYLFVPSEYYIEVPVVPQVSGPVADMVNLVPLLLIVGLIIAAVAAFITLKSRGGGA